MPDTKKQQRTTERLVHKSTGLVFYYHFENGKYVGLSCNTGERVEVPKQKSDDSVPEVHESHQTND